MSAAARRFAPAAATALLFAVTLASTAIWTRNIGIEEDWKMVPPWLGEEPDLLAWLWSQNNEHRLPLQRLISCGRVRAFLKGAPGRRGVQHRGRPVQ